MKFLHTSDWHIGKTLKGRHRLDEQAGVLREIYQVAVEADVDAVLVAGDIYESVAPTADAQRLVVQTLLAFTKRDIEVVLIAGNHDHGATFEAYKPLMDAAGIHVFGHARPVDKGGVHHFTAKSTGEKAVVAVLPFLSQRYAVRAAEIIANTPSQNVGRYDQMVRDVLANLTTGFEADTVNIVMAHLTCTGGTFGGGERAAQSIMEYHVPASIFPPEAHYVALGHLHRRQEIAAACPVHYCGAPFPVDFGEQDNTNVVLLVEASPSTPAKVTDVPISSGRRMRTIEGTVAELVAMVADVGDDFLRVRVKQANYSGLRDDILDALPNTLEIRFHDDFSPIPALKAGAKDGPVRTPAELFADYCGATNVADERVNKLFDTLHDELTSSSRHA